MEANSYIAQRLAAVGGNSEIETLREENARLKQQLEQVPDANFKSDAQAAFEQSPEFESILNAFFLRFMREKFGTEFRDSTFIQEFQIVASKAFPILRKNTRGRLLRMHMVIKALREQAQPTLAKIKASEKISPQELKDATEMYELAYYLRKFDDMEPEEESGKDQDDDNDLMSHLRDELDGAEEYYGLWLQTRVPEYKMMAQQELSHAEFWMKQARQSGIPQAELASYITRHGSLTTSLT